MPTRVYKLIDSVKDVICSRLDRAALFARKVCLARSTEIYFLLDDIPPNIKSKYKPDALFWYDDI